jgi:hypothetical protein
MQAELAKARGRLSVTGGYERERERDRGNRLESELLKTMARSHGYIRPAPRVPTG